MIEEKETGADGAMHQTSFAYDSGDRCIQKIDPFNHVTRYTYDLISDKVIKAEMPDIVTMDGQTASVAVSSVWDSYGREISKTDANGNVTKFAYNVYGSPTKIEYPYLAKEHFIYTKEGRLKKYTDPDGNAAEYTYDVLGRVLSKSLYSSEGALVADEFFEYNSFQLLKKTDREGNPTDYAYDGAGRKRREEFCGRVKEYAYDSLGRYPQ